MRKTSLLPTGVGPCLLLLAVCTNDHNPFADNSNARMAVTAGGFADNEEVRIFTTHVMELSPAVAERIDSVTIHADSNRFFRNTTIRPVQGGAYRCSVSFTDTGTLWVRIVTYRAGSDATESAFRVHAVSPLGQDTVRGFFGDPIDLATDSVADRDIMYHWSFGEQTLVESPYPKTRATIYTADNELGIGSLWVSDGRYLSPTVPFTFSFQDTGGPSIEWANMHDGDTLVTVDTEFPFKVRITDRGGGGVYYATINDTGVEPNRNQIYTRLFTGLDSYPRTSPLMVTVYAVDNLQFGNPARDTFWLAWDKSGSTSARTDLAVANVERDTVVSRTPRYRIIGTVEDYARQTVVVALSVNGTEVGDTVFADGWGEWGWSFALGTKVNTVVVTARDTGSKELAERRITIIHDPSATDDDGPVFTEITVNGRTGTEIFTADTAGLLSVSVFDEKTGVKAVAVNGATATPAAGGYRWTYRVMPLEHLRPATAVSVSAVDSLGNSSDTVLMVLRNALPAILAAPELPYPAGAGGIYAARIDTRDLDGDIVRVLARHVPRNMTVSVGGTVTWQPQLADTGVDSMVVQLYDGLQFTETVSWPTLVIDEASRPARVRFLTEASEFPTVLQASVETLSVTLRVDPSSGRAPYRFAAHANALQRVLLDSSTSGQLRWAPQPLDTGYRAIECVVWDAFRSSDTLMASVRVVPANRPYTATVTVEADTTATGAIDLSQGMEPETVVVSVSDPDLVYGPPAERLTVTVTQGGTGVSVAVDSTGMALVVLDPSARASGYDTVRIAVSDRSGLRDTVVKVAYYGLPPSPPQLLSPADSAIVVDTVVTLRWTCTDPDGNSLAYDVYFGPAGAMARVATAIRDTSLIIGSLQTSGPYVWQVKAYDMKSASSSATRQVRLVNPAHVRLATTASAFPRFVETGAAVAVTLGVTPSTGRLPFAFTATHAERSLSLLSGTADTMISWTPRADDTGYQHIAVTVRDGWRNSDSLIAAVLVVPANAFPCGLTASHDGPVTAGGDVDMRNALGPVTISYAILDRDHILTETYTVRVIRSNTETIETLDSTRSFEVVATPDLSREGKQTIRAIVSDVTGTRDTADVVLDYGTIAKVVRGPAGVTTDLALWLRADTAVAITAMTTVTAWGDISGNGHRATAKGASAPQYRGSNAQLGGRPVVETYVTTANPVWFELGDIGVNTKTDSYTIFVVKSSSSAGTNNAMLSAGTSLRLGEKLPGYVGGTQASVTFSQTAVVTLAQGSGLRTWENGAALSSQTPAGRGSGDGTPWVLAANYAADPMDSFFRGFLAEVIVYKRDIGTSERQAIEAYLKTRYGIARGVVLSKTVRFSTTASGANVGSDVYDVPMLVRLTAANFDFAGLPASDPPLRFVKSNGQSVPYETARWSTTANSADIWVLMDTVRASLAAQTITMHVDSVRQANSSPQSVFDTANGFLGVWHMETVPVLDATANGYDGTEMGTLSAGSARDGEVGSSLELNGDNEGVLVDVDSTVLEEYTFSFWVRGTSAPRGGLGWGRRNISKPFSIPPQATEFTWDHYDSVATKSHQLLTNPVSPRAWIRARVQAPLYGQTWYMVDCRYDGTTASVYVNGALQAGAVAAPGVGTGVGRIALGYDVADTEDNGGAFWAPFSGRLDEVHFSKVARSPAWIKLCYENQRSGSTVVTVE